MVRLIWGKEREFESHLTRNHIVVICYGNQSVNGEPTKF